MNTETKIPEPAGADVILDDQFEGLILLLVHRGYDLEYVLMRMFDLSLENLHAFAQEPVSKQELHKRVDEWFGDSSKPKSLRLVRR